MGDHIQNEWKLWAYPNPGFGLHRFESFGIQNLLSVSEPKGFKVFKFRVEGVVLNPKP